ncbi:hypothetical protein MiSe_54390 [Microseira wollei NIES-4236]|uniref:Transposase n=1 Tax=Microseira wollei NIES-4236 TaxID=2530354 RepID=A0AAV3XDN9_9CYAN|nr:hypothetical protein MiSe_54390 [Microseira wollei NIES-4236]
MTVNSQIMLTIALYHPEVYGLAWVRSKSAKVRNQVIRTSIEWGAIAFARLINPEATWAIPALKLCF